MFTYFCGPLQTALDKQMLGAFQKLLAHTKASIQKEACWTISNVTAGNQNQIQAVIDSGLVPLVLDCLIKVCTQVFLT